MRQVRLEKERLIITFPYDPALVLAVKTLSGRWWHSDDKYWSADLNVQNIEKLVELNFSLSFELQEWHACITAPQPELSMDITIPGSRKELYPFQRQGVVFMESKGGKVLLADQQGLGKTAQALSWLQLRKKDVLPAVVICPSSIKLNWQKEVSMWTDLTSTVWSGRNASSGYDAKADIHIINYDILAKVTENEGTGRKNVEARPDILALKAKTVIIDEAHLCKDSRAQRSKAVLALCKTAKHVIALTGTPVVNRPIEIYNTLKAVAPILFPSFTKFAFRYCAPVHNGYGWNFKGASNTKELHELLTNSVMLRRLKEDVLKELPPKVRSVVPLEINNRKEYNKAASDLIAWLRGIDLERAKAAERAKALVRFEALKQLTVQGKLTEAIEWIKDYLENENKLVVFASHKFVINALMKEFGSIAVKLDGSCSIEQRQEAVDRFQNDVDVKLFIGNIQAAGIGITLTAASSTCFIEEPWSPSLVDQAEDRVHRIGQEADSVNAYHLIAQDTIEEDIMELLDSKRKVIDDVLDGRETDDSSLLKELMKKWRR